MSSLNNRQKQLIFDYCFGLAPEQEITEAEALIKSNEEATEIISSLKSALTPLDSFAPDDCPDDLVESTIFRLNNAARSSQMRLEQLLASEQVRTNRSFWWNFSRVAAAAVVIIAVMGVYFAPLRFMRQKSWQKRCEMQLGQVFKGFSNYVADHDGRQPSVATKAGSPWWKVSYPGEENYSNTRHIWLLVKGDYVSPDNFVCPGKSQGRALQLDTSQVKNYNDFPARRYITYSFRIMCDKKRLANAGQKVLMSDSNPIFETLPQDYSKPLRIQLSKKLFNSNSTNHNGRGQNVLFWDGSHAFKKTRRFGVGQDDIFTLKNTQIYKGTELPSCETDAFLAP